jgi:hypothetical protein
MPLGEYVSVVRLAPCSIANERRQYVALRGYFDGSGSNEIPHRAITLAGLSAAEKVWPQFERAWGLALDDLGLKIWHTADLRYYMTDAAFFRATDKLGAVIAEFREAPMVSYRATVLLDDYRRAKAEFPSLMPPEALCVDGCIGNLVFPTDDDMPAILYFDRDEKFRRQIEHAWRQRRKMFDRDWSRQIEDILSTDSSRRGIQAADLLAWFGNTYEAARRRSEWAPMGDMAMHSLYLFFVAYPRYMLYGYDEIVAAYQRRQRT